MGNVYTVLPREALVLRSPPDMLLFSYGSNSLQQLQGRITAPPALTAAPAVALDYVRVFCGSSARWCGGSVASMVPAPGHVCFGMVATLTPQQLEQLKEFEGG